MRALCFPVLALLLLPSLAESQADWRSLLQKDLVTIQEGQMTLDRFTLDKIEFPGMDPVTIQVKYHGEAPAKGIISRDNLVAYTVSLGSMIMLASYSEAYAVPMTQFLDAFDSEDLDAPIGTPDMEVNLIMTTGGVQFEIVNNNTRQRFRSTSTWEDIFAESR